MMNEEIVGTIGTFYRKNGALLPIEKIFSWHGNSDSVEIGRFSLYSGVKSNAAIAIVKLLFLTMAEHYRQSRWKFFIETHSKILALFYWAIKVRGIFCLVRGAQVIPCRIPAKSRKFYEEMNPRLYKINTSKLPF
ncbi:hypothetical protein KAU19_06155, partial [Candidatus Parcubacteria bacterium]|nr:hypothetical protein [Candidatus Parcubacteria bacterium]